MDAFPDPESLSRDELKAVLKALTEEEAGVSERRHVLHARIDAYRRELVNRLREAGDLVIEGTDLEDLDDGSAGVREPRTPPPQRGAGGVALPKPSPIDHDDSLWRHPPLP